MLMRCFEWSSLGCEFPVQRSIIFRLMHYIHLCSLKWSGGPFLILHEAAFIISRREGHLSSPLLGVSVWISCVSGDEATFSSPLLHNCLSVRNTQGCGLLAGEVLWCTPIPPVSCCTVVSLAELSHFSIKSPMRAELTTHSECRATKRNKPRFWKWQNLHSFSKAARSPATAPCHINNYSKEEQPM